MVILLMGVSGSGKSLIGKRLAGILEWPFIDGDDLHPAANVAKMARGEPLTDADRAPWLGALRAQIDACRASGTSAVVACSALKQVYREQLCAECSDVHLVHLTADPALLRKRLEERTGHFFKAGLLQSQLDTLEPPADALTVDVAVPPDVAVQQIRDALDV